LKTLHRRNLRPQGRPRMKLSGKRKNSLAKCPASCTTHWSKTDRQRLARWVNSSNTRWAQQTNFEQFYNNLLTDFRTSPPIASMSSWMNFVFPRHSSSLMQKSVF
jgi:hypothetical protein